jgi:hypothetical protein
MYAKPGYEVYDVLTEAEKLCQAKDLTPQLLTFAEGSRPVKKTLYLGELQELGQRRFKRITNKSGFLDTGKSPACRGR